MKRTPWVCKSRQGRIIRQNWLVNISREAKLNRRQRLYLWMVGRTHLEYGLVAFSTGLIILLVVLLVALNRESAPLETVWGNVAEWAGVIVTFFGFGGAIAALRIQRRSVEIQDEQRRDEVQEKSAADFARQVRGKAIVSRQLEQEAKRRREEREKFARSVELQVRAEHQRALPGLQRPSDGQLALSVKAFFREQRGLIPPEPYTEALLIIPHEAELAGMDESISRIGEKKLGAPGFRRELAWRVTGDGQFQGDDNEALKWLIPRVGVEFSDPKGIRWRISGDKELEELPAEDSSKTIGN